MSPANLRELLTAAVDGELTPTEAKVARRLLRESEAARTLFTQLKADAARIKALRPVPAPVDLADTVMAVINERAITPTPLPPARQPGRKFNWAMLPVWVNFATAAAVLLLISAGSYMYFAATQNYMAQQRESTAVAKSPLPSYTDPAPKNPSPVVVQGPMPKVVPDRKDVEVVVLSPEKGPSPRLVPDNTLTAPPVDVMPEIEPFDLDKIRVSQLFTLQDLPGDEAARKKLAAEMKKDELIRLDLFCQTTPKALEIVLAALKARGVTMVADTFAQDRMKRKAPTELMIFTEAMTSDEVAQLLTALGADDKKSGEFSKLVAAPFLQADLDRLGKLLGLPAVRSVPKGKLPVDIRKPLPEGTANAVAATLSKMGGGSPTPPKAERMAVVVAYSPANPSPGASKEIKSFLERRGERKADAKPLMLVLRTIQ